MTDTDTGDVRAVWDAVSDGWARHHEEVAAHTRPITDRMLELVAARPGETVLELAAGLGDLSRALATAVAPDGRVICSDVSPRMVAAARDRTPAGEGLTFRVLDAQRLAVDDDTVDAVVCKLGLMLLPDPAKAAAECRRALRPGGRLVVATWGAPERNLWIAMFGAALLAHGHGPPGDPDGPGGIFSLARPETLEELLTAAGFDEVAVDAVDAPEVFTDFDDYWELHSQTGGPLALALRELGTPELDLIRDTCAQYAANLRQPDGSYHFPGEALVARAR